MASKSRPFPAKSDSSDPPAEEDVGFGEAPQPPLEGAPLAGPVSAWAGQIANDPEAKPKRRVKGRGDPTLSDRSIPLNPTSRQKLKDKPRQEEKPLKTARG